MVAELPFVIRTVLSSLLEEFHTGENPERINSEIKFVIASLDGNRTCCVRILGTIECFF